MPKDRWDKLDICVKAFAAILGVAFTVVYQFSQKELNGAQKEATKARLESDVIALIRGKEEIERKLGIHFAKTIAQRFNDYDFFIMIAEFMKTGDPDPQVREEAKQAFELFFSTFVKPADNYFAVGRYNEAIKQYEKAIEKYENAIQSMPSGIELDQKRLLEARMEAKQDPNSQRACFIYRDLLSRFR